MNLLLSFLILPIMGLATEIPPVSPVEGRWELVDRACSSGMPVRDAFQIGRDRMILTFDRGHYDGMTEVQGCRYYVSGKFEVRGQFLRVYDVSGASNCRFSPPVRDESLVHLIDASGALKVFSGTLRGPYTSCPQGDQLESTFNRLF